MKTLIYFSILLAVTLTSCDKKDNLPAPIENIITDKSIKVQDLTLYTNTAPIRDRYHLLGYGYDVTGEYADSASARHQVVDVAALDKAEPTMVEIGKSTSGGAMNIATAHAEELVYAISGRSEDSRFFGMKEQDAKRYFGKEITTYFPDEDTFSDKYLYGRQRLELIYKTVYFLWSRDYNNLTPEFLSDCNVKTPAQLIEKYGTHVLTRINLGAKFTIMYQSKTDQIHNNNTAQLGFSVALAKTFGSFSGYLDHWGKESAPGIFSQKISFKATGGDVKKIRTIADPTTGIVRVDYSDWLKSISQSDPELVDIVRIEPIYVFIADAVKKEEVKKYFEAYLQENAPGRL